MINIITGINNITYNPSELPQGDFLHYFNQALAEGYEPNEARRIAKIKEKQQKEKEKKSKKKNNKNKDIITENSNHIDRRA